MVEAVASAGERKTVLAAAFAFASVLAHAHFATTRARRWQVVSLACFALALLSKPSALTLPLGLIVLDAWPLRRLSMATVLEKWPFLALSAVSGVISILAVRHTWERMGRASEAAASFQRGLAIRPDDTAARTRLGAAQAALGRTGASAEVVQLLRRAIAAKPDWADPFNELAWVLATAADSSLRDPGEALRLSQLALGLTRSPDPSLLDTRAASLAAAGRFDEAAGVAERASALAHEQSLDSLRADIDRRARFYRRGRPFVQQPASNR